MRLTRPARAAGSYLVGGVTGDLDHEQEVLVKGPARLLEVDVEEAPVVRTTRDAGADRQRGLLEPFACLGPERVGAGESLAVAEQREEAV
jgi:hypothetical protein